MRTAIKALKQNPSEELYRAASSAIDKAETKGLIHKTKLAVIKHVLQQNWLIKHCIQNELLGAFFCCFQMRRRHENYDYRLFRIRQVNFG